MAISRRRIFGLLAGCLVIAVAASAAVLAIAPLRAAAARNALAFALSTKGLDLGHADIAIGGREASARDLVVTNLAGRSIITARDVDVHYSLSLRGVTITMVSVDSPRVVASRLPDGSFDLADLVSGGSGGSSSPLEIAIERGTLDVVNVDSPAAFGRALAFRDINAAFSMRPGAISRGTVAAELESGASSTPIRATLLENDESKVASATIRVSDTLLAPIVDLLTSSKAFAIESGTADAEITAYAIGWYASSGPSWHLVGSGVIRNACLRTMPLVAAVCGINGAVGLRDGTLLFPSLAARASGIGMRSSGLVSLVPSAVIDLDVRAVAPLSRIRGLLAFSRTMPLHGSASVDAEVRGAIADPHVEVRLRAPHGVGYGGVPVTELSSDVYYHDGHVTILSADARYAGARIFGDGDIDLTSSPVSAEFEALAASSADRLPVLSQLTPHDTVRIAGAFEGPLTQLGGEGFADASGRGTALRAVMQADSQQFTVSAIARDSAGGQLFAAADIARATGAAANADLVANRFSLESSGRAVGLPGVVSTRLALPLMRARIDGAAAMLGSLATPFGRVAMTVSDGSVADLPSIGTISLRRASIKATLIGRAWIGDATLTGARALIAGKEEKLSAHAIVAQTGTQIKVYGATAQIAGGSVAVNGTVPGSRPGTLDAYVSHVDGALLAAFGAPVTSGKITAFARLTGPLHEPRLTVFGAMSNGMIAGRALSGDGSFRYANGDLQIFDTRVTTANTLAYVDGVVSDLGRASSGGPPLALHARLPDVDLGSVASSFGSTGDGIAGLADADMRIGGSMSEPTVSGELSSDIGALRGVTYDELHANLSGSSGDIDIANGSVRFGGTRLAVTGSLSPSSIAMGILSPHVDLNDFNDFFDGKDVLEGHGSLAMALSSNGGRLHATGNAHMRDVVLDGVPAGAVNVGLSQIAGAAVATVHQYNSLGSAVISAGIEPRTGSTSTIPDFATARYSLAGQIRDVNLARIAPYIGAEDDRLAGIVAGSVRAAGSLTEPMGDAIFTVSHGSVRGVGIDDASADIHGDGRYVQLRSLRADGNGMTLAAAGRVDFARRTVALRAHAAVNDLAAAARLVRISGSARGSLTADVQADGALTRPTISARIAAPAGELHGVAYDSAYMTANYGDRRLRVTGNLQFASRRGTLALTGSVPIRLAPFGIGSNDQTIAFQARTVDVGIGVIDPLLGGVATLGGALDSNLRVSGTVGQPVVSGTAQIRNGVLASRYDSIGARSVNADLALNNDSIELQRFQAALGAGSLAANGVAHVVPATALHPAPSLQFTVHAQLANAQVNVPDLIDGEVSGSIAVTKPGRRPFLSGDLELTNTSVPFDSLLALASHGSTQSADTKNVPGVPEPLPGRESAYAGSLYGSDFTLVTRQPLVRPHVAAALHISRTFDLGLRVTALKNVGVTGAISASGTGTIAVTGTTKAPKLSGTLTAVRGRASFVNTRFDLNDGFVTFDPADGLLPTIEANATTSTDEADITVTISGRVDQLHTDFSSVPEMSQDAIVATLLHIPQINSALASSHGLDQSQFGVSSQDVVTGALANQMLGALNVGLNQLFDVGEVNLELDQTGHAGLEVRHPFGPHAYTIFKTSFSVPPAQSFGVAYIVRQALSVEFTQSQATPGTSPVLAPPLTSIQVQLSFH